MKTKLRRQYLVESVAEGLECSARNDLPMIRQALDDTTDSLTRDGFIVPDWSQDLMVKSVQIQLERRMGIRS